MVDVHPIITNSEVFDFYRKQKSEFHFEQRTDDDFVMFLLDTAVRVISIVQHLAPVIEAVSGCEDDDMSSGDEIPPLTPSLTLSVTPVASVTPHVMPHVAPHVTPHVTPSVPLRPVITLSDEVHGLNQSLGLSMLCSTLLSDPNLTSPTVPTTNITSSLSNVIPIKSAVVSQNIDIKSEVEDVSMVTDPSLGPSLHQLVSSLTDEQSDIINSLSSSSLSMLNANTSGSTTGTTAEGRLPTVSLASGLSLVGQMFNKSDRVSLGQNVLLSNAIPNTSDENMVKSENSSVDLENLSTKLTDLKSQITNFNVLNANTSGSTLGTTAEGTTNQLTYLSLCEMLNLSEQFTDLFNLIRNNEFPVSQHKRLQEMWHQAHYRLAERDKCKSLNPVDKHRIRKKFPLPPSIWDGQVHQRSFEEHSRRLLKEQYRKCPLLSHSEKLALAAETGLSFEQIKNWFKNKRQRDRNKIRNYTSQDGLP